MNATLNGFVFALVLLFSPVENAPAIGTGNYVLASSQQFGGELLEAAQAEVTLHGSNGLTVTLLQDLVRLSQLLGELLQQLIPFPDQFEARAVFDLESDLLVRWFFHVVDQIVEVKQELEMHFDDFGHFLFPFCQAFFDIIDRCYEILRSLGLLYQILLGNFLGDLNDLTQGDEILISGILGRRDDQEYERDRFLIDTIETDRFRCSPDRDFQLLDGKGTAMRYSDALADAG
jgi:hypothetical protein